MSSLVILAETLDGLTEVSQICLADKVSLTVGRCRVGWSYSV